MLITVSQNPKWTKEKDRGGAQQPHGPCLSFWFLGFGYRTRLNGVRMGALLP